MYDRELDDIANAECPNCPGALTCSQCGVTRTRTESNDSVECPHGYGIKQGPCPTCDGKEFQRKLWTECFPQWKGAIR